MQMFCPKHRGALAQSVCPHVIDAYNTTKHCPQLEYRSYSAADPGFAGIELGALFCSQCRAELPEDRAVIQDVDAFLETRGDLFSAMCQGCFEEWRSRGSNSADEATGFLDRSEFAFVNSLESAWQAIRDEYLALPAERFDPWVQQGMHGGGWSVFGLYACGQAIPGAGVKCPATVRALEGIPDLSMAGFSRLAPRSHVKPHVGWAMSVYRLHLPLVVPPRCRLRVGSETRSWEQGRCLIFDDTVEHEAWNDSEHSRGVLLLDFLRPGTTGNVQDHVPEEVRQYVSQLQGRS